MESANLKIVGAILLVVAFLMGFAFGGVNINLSRDGTEYPRIECGAPLLPKNPPQYVDYDSEYGLRKPGKAVYESRFLIDCSDRRRTKMIYTGILGLAGVGALVLGFRKGEEEKKIE